MLYGLCSWGLGHATRSLPIIRRLIGEGCEVSIATHGRSLNLLKKELMSGVEYIELADYPLPYSSKGAMLVPKLLFSIPQFISAMRREHEYVVRHEEEYDLIVSDSRYGFYSLRTASVLMSHQLRYMSPGRIKILERGTEYLTLYFKRKYKSIMVPDFEENGLAGDLAHNLSLIKEDEVHYIGPLSDFRREECTEDIDFFFSVSGPEPQRTLLEEKILSQVEDIEGRVVVTLGKSETEKKVERGHTTLYTFLTKEERNALLNRSKLIISRSGYSTIMDLCILGKKALFIPTPGQTEQEYLSDYHMHIGTYMSVAQEEINLKTHLQEAKKYRGYRTEWSTEKSVERALEVLGI